MKKQLLLIVMLLSIAASAFAVEVEIDGLWYEVVAKAKEAKVIKYKNNVTYKGNIVIPEAVVYEGTTCSVTSIGNEAFYVCRGLTSVTIPNSVTSIDNYTFYNCSGLTSVTIGSGVKYINSSAFANCPELTDVTCYAETVPFTRSDTFEGSYIENVTLHVPTSSINSYKTTEPWSNFKEIKGIALISKGDVNSDIVVDVADVVAIVNYILGEPDNGFNEAVADVNGDGKIDVDDVVQTVNIILGE